MRLYAKSEYGDDPNDRLNSLAVQRAFQTTSIYGSFKPSLLTEFPFKKKWCDVVSHLMETAQPTYLAPTLRNSSVLTTELSVSQTMIEILGFTFP